MPEQEVPVIKRTLSPFIEAITQKGSWKHENSICGTVTLDLDKIIFTEQVNPDDKYLKQPYIDLIALDNLNQISDSEQKNIKRALENTCKDFGIDFNIWKHQDRNCDLFNGDMLRSGDLYLADCFFNKLHPNIVFIVPENSKVSLKGGEVYIDGSITYLESYFRNIKDKYIDYIESENNGQKVNFLLLNDDFEKVEYEYLKTINPLSLMYSKEASMSDLNIKKIGNVKNIPISSLNNYHPQISMPGCSYAEGYAAPPRIMFTKP